MERSFGNIAAAKGNIVECSLQWAQNSESVGRRDRGKSQIRVHRLAVASRTGEQDESVRVLSDAIEGIMEFMGVKADRDRRAGWRNRREYQGNYEPKPENSCFQSSLSLFPGKFVLHWLAERKFRLPILLSVVLDNDSQPGIMWRTTAVLSRGTVPAADPAGTHVTSKYANHNTQKTLAAHYRKLADEAHALANTTVFAELRNSYLRYEAHWRALADEVDERSGPGPFWRWLSGIFHRR